MNDVRIKYLWMQVVRGMPLVSGTLDWYNPMTDLLGDYESAKSDAAKGNERAQRYMAAYLAERMKG